MPPARSTRSSGRSCPSNLRVRLHRLPWLLLRFVLLAYPRFVEIDEAAAYFFVGGGLGLARRQALDHRQFLESRAELAARGFGEIALSGFFGALLFQRALFGAAIQMRLAQQ